MTIVVLGTGGMGREALAWLADEAPTARIAGFLDENPDLEGTEVAGYGVLGGLDWLEHNNAAVVVAIGAPTSRKRLVEGLLARSVSLRTIIHPSAYLGPGVTIGTGSIICPNVTLTRDAQVGHAVIVNYGAQIGHDAHLDAYVFVGPAAALAGNVHVHEGVEVGIGASVLPGRSIGPWARVGAGAVVIHDIPGATTAVGVPARTLPSAQPAAGR